MGFFKKKVCVICGTEAGLLSRQKIANDEYICSDCERKCGRLIFSSTFKQMEREDILRQMEETANNKEILANLFTETDYVDLGKMTPKHILSIDATHGWIAIPQKDPTALFTFDQIGGADVHLQTRTIRDEVDPHAPNAPQGHGPQGHAPNGPMGHGPQGHGPQPHHPVRRMMPIPPAGLPACAADQEVTGIDVRITILNSNIKWFDLDVMDAVFPTDSDIIRGYQNAAHLLDLLNWCKTSQMTQNVVEQITAAAAQVVSAAAPTPAPAPAAEPAPAAAPAISSDSIAQVKQLKELLDLGAITQEEFDMKKKQLLGL